jgi:hypothetical protein
LNLERLNRVHSWKHDCAEGTVVSGVVTALDEQAIPIVRWPDAVDCRIAHAAGNQPATSGCRVGTFLSVSSPLSRQRGCLVHTLGS